MRPRTLLITAILYTAGPAAGALAQQGAVSFAFDGSSLQVQLLTGGAAGSAEVIDGEDAAITVTDRSGNGGVALSLNGGVLSLENRSGSRSDFLIAVPARASVALSVDGQTVLAVAPAGGGRRLTWTWPGVGRRAASRVWVEGGGGGGGGAPTQPVGVPLVRHTFTVNAFSGELVADSVDVLYPERIQALKIIVGGDVFRVSGDRSVSFRYWEKARWGMITPRSEELEVTVEVPSDVASLEIRIGGVVVWDYKNGQGRAHCDPVAEIRRRDGRFEWVLTPEAGQLRCPADRGPIPA